MAHGQANAEICENQSPTLNCNHEVPIAFCASGKVAHSLRGESFNAGEDGTIRGTPHGGVQMAIAFERRFVRTSGGQPSVNLQPCLRADTNTGDGAPCVAFGGEIARTLSARHDSSPCADPGMDVVAQGMQVRRLTPRECERLQALPDDWAKIPWRGKPAADCPDGPRYKGIGNGQTVNVMRWLAQRIKKAIAV